MLALRQFPPARRRDAIENVRPIEDIRHANLLLVLDELGGGNPRNSLAKLAELTGKSHSQLSQLKIRAAHSKTGNPRTIGPKMARDIEAAVHKPRGWMDTEHNTAAEPPAPWMLRQHTNKGNIPIRGEQSHPVRLNTVDDAPLISWEALSMAPPTSSQFKVEMPDDSMAPRIRMGHVARIDTSILSRPGDAVLVRDREGRYYVRLYRERRPGVWEAAPMNDAYQPLQSDTDGLQVIGVLTGVDGRWG